jgi:hypothetical protein
MKLKYYGLVLEIWFVVSSLPSPLVDMHWILVQSPKVSNPALSLALWLRYQLHANDLVWPQESIYIFKLHFTVGKVILKVMLTPISFSLFLVVLGFELMLPQPFSLI